MEQKKPYLSQSQLTMYERCGEAYRRRYLENEKIPPGIAMLKGIGVHDGSMANFRQKIESKQDLPKQDIIDIAVSKYDVSLKYDVLLTPEEESRYDNIVAETRDSIVSLSGLYADEVAPEYQPATVELEQKVELPGSHDIVAKMDIADTRDIIADLKTTSRKKNQKDVDGDEQLTFYSLAFYGKMGHLPYAVRLETLVDKTRPERQMLESQRDMQDLETIIARINTMLDGLKKGVFIPALSSSWQCDPRYCGYAMSCKYFLKARQH